MLIMTLFTKIVLIGWKVWWIVSLLIVIVKHHLAHKFKWPDKTLCNCEHWWINLIQGPSTGFSWFLDYISQIFPEECLLFRFVYKQLISLSRVELSFKMFTFTVDKLWYWIWTFYQFFIFITVIFIQFVSIIVKTTTGTSWLTWWQINIFWTNTTCKWLNSRGATHNFTRSL